MMGSRRYFERAEQAYDRAIHLIRTLDKSFQSAAFQDTPEERYDTRITLYQFDVILQAILLRMALTDGNFHRLERRLIDKITRYGDLLNYLRRETDGRLDLTWEKIDSQPAAVQDELMERLPEILDRTCNSFVLPLALVDGAVDSIDFLERLERELREIAESLSGVDGDSRETEQEAYSDMLEHLLTSRWHRIRAEEAQRQAESQ